MRRTIAGIGRALVTVGLLILLFVAYQLWGTGIFTARAQAELKKDFARLQREHTPSPDDPLVSTSTSVTSVPRPTTPSTLVDPRALPPVKAGDVLGKIDIEKIGAHWAFVESTSRDALKKGPGHYLDTPVPGELGNAAIAGHRTTYGAPFNRLDELDAGDLIVVETVAGTWTYRVDQHPFAVRPTDLSVVDNTPDAELTLTTCTPKFSASQRLIVKAKLVVDKSPTPVPPPPPPAAGRAKPHRSALEDGLSGQKRSLRPATLWGIVVVIVGLGWWWAFRRWRHPLTWIVGVVPLLVVLFAFYVFLERALPAGY